MDTISENFIDKLIKKRICNDCDPYCKVYDLCPKMTLTTNYVLKYLSLQRMLQCIVYPRTVLSWLNQDAWYILLFTAAYNKKIQLYNLSLKKTDSSKGK